MHTYGESDEKDSIIKNNQFKIKYVTFHIPFTMIITSKPRDILCVNFGFENKFWKYFSPATRHFFFSYPISSNVACARHFDVLSVIKGHSVRRATEISKRRNYLIYFKTSPLTKSWQDETKILSVFGVFVSVFFFFSLENIQFFWTKTICVRKNGRC